MANLRAIRAVPLARVLAAAELVVLAREHLNKLEPHERRRIVELLARSRGRPRSLSVRERHELARLVRKAEPRGFARGAAQKLSGLPLPEKSRWRR